MGVPETIYSLVTTYSKIREGSSLPGSVAAIFFAIAVRILATSAGG
jgi:hypothetical protein